MPKADPLRSARPLEDPQAEAYDRLAKQTAVARLVLCDLASEVRADPKFPASEVLRRMRAVLPDIPSTPEGAIQR